MQEIRLGALLEEFRKKQNLPRTHVCLGICSSAAFTRYEQFRTPDPFIFDCLFERLGQDPILIHHPIGASEMQFRRYRALIEDSIHKKEYKNAKKLLKNYETFPTWARNIHGQYINLKKGEIELANQKYPRAIKLFKQSLKLTDRLSVLTSGIGDTTLSHMEIDAIYQLALAYINAPQPQERDYFFLIRELRYHLAKRDDTNSKKKQSFPSILYRYAQLEYNNDNFGESYSCLQQAEIILVGERRIEELEDIINLRIKIENIIKSLKKEDTVARATLISRLSALLINSPKSIPTDEVTCLWEKLSALTL